MKAIFALLALAATLNAQTPQDAKESGLASEFRRQSEHFHQACGEISFKAAAGCGIELFTDHPLHIAAGSIAPQNGFGLGAALVGGTNTSNYRFSWNLDAVASTNTSWRAGAYLKIFHSPNKHNSPPAPNAGEKSLTIKVASVHPYPVFNLYVQSISLNQLNFFGLGPNSTVAGKSLFGLTQTIAGFGVVKPVYEWRAIHNLHLDLLGQVNGRFVNLRGRHGQSVPSIETLYTEATAPGLANQPAFLQLLEGFRIKPSLFRDNLRLNYQANFQEFYAPSSGQYNFQRWTIDLDHSIPIWSHTQFSPPPTNGPDECHSSSADACPDVSYSRNLQGSIGVRLLLSESLNSSSATVPFYFQQTLGGSDINGAPALSSYQDYRYRAPNLLLLQERFEHSIWGPLGFQFLADQGKVALTRNDIGFSHLKHTFAAGFTLRAGGFPMVQFLYAWGGEGPHTIGSLNTSLLGGSARPPLD